MGAELTDQASLTNDERDHVVRELDEGHADEGVRLDGELSITAARGTSSQGDRALETAEIPEFDEADVLLVLATGQDGGEIRAIGDLPVSAERDSGDDEADLNEERDLGDSNEEPELVAVHGSEYEEPDSEPEVAPEVEGEELSGSDLEELVEFLLEPPVPVWSSAITVPGQKKNSKLFLDERTSYVYRRKSEGYKKKRAYLTCQHDYCRASATLVRGGEENGDLICQTSHHEHDPDQDYRDSKMFRGLLYHRAQTESTPCKKIYEEEALK